MRNFDTGATRDVDTNKHDPEGFLSPAVLEGFFEYMHRNRFQADGKMRDSDNWQKGIPKDVYMKSAWRHFFDVWKEHRGLETPQGMKDNLYALLFNIMGYLHEELREDDDEEEDIGYEEGSLWHRLSLRPPTIAEGGTIKIKVPKPYDVGPVTNPDFTVGANFDHGLTALELQARDVGIPAPLRWEASEEDDPNINREWKIDFDTSYVPENYTLHQTPQGALYFLSKEQEPSVSRIPGVDYGQILRLHPQLLEESGSEVAPHLSSIGAGATEEPIRQSEIEVGVSVRSMRPVVSEEGSGSGSHHPSGDATWLR
jgi:hypothetical protein